MAERRVDEWVVMVQSVAPATLAVVRVHGVYHTVIGTTYNAQTCMNTGV